MYMFLTIRATKQGPPGATLVRLDRAASWPDGVL
jgi:hypothetical protein